MLTCPMCRKALPEREKTCRNCKADVSLLVDYVTNLEEGLKAAERLTKAGELGNAVWAYLAVLEVDPDNAVARRQVGRVATTVRQFDGTAPGRRWMKQLHRRKGFARWLQRWKEGDGGDWFSNVLWFVVLVGVLMVGYAVGHYNGCGTFFESPKSEEGRGIENRESPTAHAVAEEKRENSRRGS